MNGHERFVAALHGQAVDRAAVAHVALMTSVELQESTECWMPAVHHDPVAQATLLAANHDVLGFDGIGVLINYFTEPAALGAVIEWGTPTDLPMFRSHPWPTLEDAVIPADLLSRPPISVAIDTVRYAKAKYGDRMGLVGKVMGPLSMVQVMHGLERTMMGLVEEPEVVARFLDIVVEPLAAYANVQLDEGADAILIGEGGAGASMISPAMYEEILLPIHQRLVRRINGPTILHMCGDVRPRLEMIRRTGITCFNFDWAVPPEEMVRAARGHFTVMGNVNTADILNAEPEVIRRQVRECLDAGVQIISPGCAISPRCGNRNLRAIAAEVIGLPA